MLRKLYPILLTISAAMTIGIYLHPGEARKWIRQAGQWGSQVASDALRATVVLADETRANLSQAGYASTNPSTSNTDPYSPTPNDPAWTYVADEGRPATTLGAPVAPPASPSGYYYYQPNSPSAVGSATAQPPNSHPDTYPRVLATGPNNQDPRYSNQPLSPYPAASEYPGNGGSHSAPLPENPLRPSMPRQAPWSATTDRIGTASEPESASAYHESRPQPSLGGTYPKVQWAGDWRDYRGVPETVKPTDQSAYGYLPPPDVDSTSATVDRYLPNPAENSAAPSADAALQPQVVPGPSIDPPAVTAVPSPQDPYGSTMAAAPGYWLPPPMMPSPQGTGAVPYQRYDVAQPQPPMEPRVASLSPPPAMPDSLPPQPASPPGALIESPDPVADLTLCEGAQILARVGSEVVLASELLWLANQTLSGLEGIDKASESDLAKAREQLVKKFLPQHIELKLLYVDAKRTIPAEALENINKQLATRFEEVEVSDRLKNLKLNSRRELESQLAAWGTSLEHEKRAYIEREIAKQWIYEKVRKEEEVSHEQLVEYYQAHASEYDHPTRLRWEHLEVTFQRHPDKREAWQRIAAMGNAVQQGRPFAQVAKELSEGAMASSGGQHDWLTQGSLKSDVLDQALFSLPAGAMSPILEDETGFHIVRVVQREDAYRTPFKEVQDAIREKIKNERRQTQMAEFVERLRQEIPVWTVFDQPADSAVSAAASKRQF